MWCSTCEELIMTVRGKVQPATTVSNRNRCPNLFVCLWQVTERVLYPLFWRKKRSCFGVSQQNLPDASSVTHLSIETLWNASCGSCRLWACQAWQHSFVDSYSLPQFYFYLSLSCLNSFSSLKDTLQTNLANYPHRKPLTRAGLLSTWTKSGSNRLYLQTQGTSLDICSVNSPICHSAPHHLQRRWVLVYRAWSNFETTHNFAFGNSPVLKHNEWAN